MYRTQHYLELYRLEMDAMHGTDSGEVKYRPEHQPKPKVKSE